MATIAKVLRLDKMNRKGEAPIYFRITKHRKVRYISSSVRVLVRFWDARGERIKPGHPNSARLNSFLSNKFTELQDKVYEHETVLKSLDAAMLKDYVMGKPPAEFFKYAEKDLDGFWQEGKLSTHRKNTSIIQKLQDYVKNRTIYFQTIDIPFLKKYEKHLRQTLGNKTNTVKKDLSYIRKLFNKAVREGVIDRSVNPFPRYPLKTEKTQRRYLTQKELELIYSI